MKNRRNQRRLDFFDDFADHILARRRLPVQIGQASREVFRTSP